MPFSARFDHDIFVSYAHVDDRPLPGARDGWVSALVGALRTLLAQQLGRAEVLTIWRDRVMPGNVELVPEVAGILQRTAVLLVVLSEGYLASGWCQLELGEFAARAGAGTRRLFVIERMPIAPARKPPALRDLLGYRFWLRDDDDLPARTLGVPAPTADEPEYYRRVHRLALELADELRRMNRP